MASRYKLFLQLCEKWPVDKAKAGRDLGTVVREQVLKAFKNGDATVVNERECDAAYESLVKINSNHYKRRYAIPSTTGCTGLSVEQCSLVTSTDGLKALNE